MNTQNREPLFEVAQLAMINLYTPKLEESIKFFEVMGMLVVHKDEEGSVYMRAYEDPYKYSLKLTPHHEAGLAKASWRATSPQALERRVEVLSKLPQGKGWVEPAYSRGKAYEFTSPDNHLFEIFFDVEYYQAEGDFVSKLNNRPQRRPLTGVPVRRLDHMNCLATDVDKNVDFFTEHLGFKVREFISNPDKSKAAAWLSVSPLVHEIAFMKDGLSDKCDPGRLHHIAYWFGDPQDLEYLSDALTELGIPIEAGPLKHGVSQAKCMYAIEPGGNRVELFGDTGYLIFDPTWKPVEWNVNDAEKSIIWYGGELPHSYFRYGTPVVEDKEIKPFY
ncbi:lactoylglutathione lyase [Listeria floridensis FSL S10-1187]|uniref:Lactoylglutathione lyase n=1 Tax=Listeria floridensis FSL S10-1187 TaxID=1265817 RepID=A0ABP3AWX3_9LIST|nr:VOC family protein [Listeria floridensis]EUJ26751.1 lactoylglutathione lyase [Listeria floridensis FSL S10-1187]